MSSETYTDGVLRERWDDTTRTYKAWNASGQQTSTRPYTAAENAAADAALAQEQASAEAATLAEAQEALVRATLALAPAPATGEAWVQPTGGHDAYPLGAKVTHNGQDWENTGSASNVWEPGVFGWVTI